MSLLSVLLCEIFIDWTKHAFVTKFNRIVRTAFSSPEPHHPTPMYSTPHASHRTPHTARRAPPHTATS